MNTGGEGAHVLTAGCLFSGMGGFAAGLIDAGFEVRWANDYDEFACAAFRHRFPDVTLVEDDVRNLSVERDNLVPVDVLAGGFPARVFPRLEVGAGLQIREEGSILRYPVFSQTSNHRTVPPLSFWRTFLIYFMARAASGLNRYVARCAES
jgi:hypothetical protein